MISHLLTIRGPVYSHWCFLWCSPQEMSVEQVLGSLRNEAAKKRTKVKLAQSPILPERKKQHLLEWLLYSGISIAWIWDSSGFWLCIFGWLIHDHSLNWECLTLSPPSWKSTILPSRDVVRIGSTGIIICHPSVMKSQVLHTVRYTISDGTQGEIWNSITLCEWKG